MATTTTTTNTTKTQRTGAWLGRKGTRLIAGAGYVALRGAYSLGEFGEAMYDGACDELEVLEREHEAKMALREVQKKLAIAAFQAQAAQAAVTMAPAV